MFTGVILVCGLAVCTEPTSTIRVPGEFDNSMKCLMQSQAYSASSGLVHEGDKIMVICQQKQEKK